MCADMGIDYDIIRHDADSTDGLIKKEITTTDGIPYVSSLYIQLKCTEASSTQCDFKEDMINYRLKVKNYNDLCKERTNPIILGLLVLPPEQKEFVDCQENGLKIYGNMYWLSLEGQLPSKNRNSVSVKIPLKNILNKNKLIDLLQMVARGDL